MIRAAILDDEEAPRAHLRQLLLRRADRVVIVGEWDNAADALPVLRSDPPDVLFLDIEMPGMDGFGLLQELGERDFDVIFATAYHRYAVQAIRFSALDYLLKPVQEDELDAALLRHQERAADRDVLRKLNAQLLENIGLENHRYMRLAVRQGGALHLLVPNEIHFCRAEDNYTELHLGDGRKFLASRTLKEYEDMLAELGFIRVHRSYLVNREAVEQVTSDGHVVLHGGQRVEISRRRREEVMRALRA
jgi:two-component system LytT family response regulator